MKIRQSTQTGSVLLVTLVVTAILGTALASYMKLVSYQNSSVVRSQFWNSAMPMSEAGIEEALAHLNNVGNASRLTNGWTIKDGQFYMSRDLSDGRYEVWINTNWQPTVKSIGYVVDPMNQKEISRTVRATTTKATSLMKGLIARKGIGMVGGNVKIDSFDSADPTGTWNTYGRYDPAKSHDYGYAGAITGDIDTGNGSIWGYVGTGPNGTVSGNVGDAVWMSSKSNPGIQEGHYANDLNVTLPPVNPPFSGGATTSLPPPGIATVTNYTYLQTLVTSATYPSPVPPGGVTTNIQIITSTTLPAVYTPPLTTNTAAVSSTTYPASGTYIGNVVTRVVTTGKGKTKTTTTYYDYNKITGYSYPQTTYTFNTTTTNASVITELYTSKFPPGNYQFTSLSMSGSQTYLITGDVTIYVTGPIQQQGQAKIVIMPGASLKIYAGGDVDLKGLGIMNLTQDASKYQLYGLPGCTNIDLGGNASFTGTIYAPNANLEMGGGGNNVYDTVGAIVVNSAKLNGKFNFHYDEMLGRITGPIIYKVASWNEI